MYCKEGGGEREKGEGGVREEGRSEGMRRGHMVGSFPESLHIEIL